MVVNVVHHQLVRQSQQLTVTNCKSCFICHLPILKVARAQYDRYMIKFGMPGTRTKHNIVVTSPLGDVRPGIVLAVGINTLDRLNDNSAGFRGFGIDFNVRCRGVWFPTSLAS